MPTNYWWLIYVRMKALWLLIAIFITIVVGFMGTAGPSWPLYIVLGIVGMLVAEWFEPMPDTARWAARFALRIARQSYPSPKFVSGTWVEHRKVWLIGICQNSKALRNHPAKFAMYFIWKDGDSQLLADNISFNEKRRIIREKVRLCR